MIAGLMVLTPCWGNIEEGLQTVQSTTVTRDEFQTTMDEVLTIVRRLDQARSFTIEWVRRIEADVDRVKKHLHLFWTTFRMIRGEGENMLSGLTLRPPGCKKTLAFF
ncbi:MAG: hypothetical protein V1778_00855 [bacterium]